MTFRVLAVASEIAPFAKTGGLADVVGALPLALKAEGVEVSTLVPGYSGVLAALEGGSELHRWDDLYGAAARLLHGRAGGLDLLVLDAPGFYARAGLYADGEGRDWPDNWKRFAALCRIGADLALGRIEGAGAFHLLHAHDWQAGLAPAFLRYTEGPRPPSVQTVHNLAFQGWFERGVFPGLGLPSAALDIEGVEHNGGVGFLKAGLRAADRITTVSPTYAEEIRRPGGGMGLEGLLQSRRGRLYGILNGVDAKAWDPAHDPHLARTYGERTLKRRAANRAAVERIFALEPSEGPLFCVVSRLTGQKGIDLLIAAIDALVAHDARLAVLGSGEAALEAGLQAAAARHPGRVGVRLGYDEALSHQLQGGADAILIPSRFEPCGLTQLYGLRYGCVPVAARVGGLADSLIDVNLAAMEAGAATAVLFDPHAPGALPAAITRAVTLFVQPRTWRAIQGRGMRTDVSWARSAALYAHLFREVAG